MSLEVQIYILGRSGDFFAAILGRSLLHGWETSPKNVRLCVSFHVPNINFYWHDWLITMGPVSWCLRCTASFWLIVQLIGMKFTCKFENNNGFIHTICFTFRTLYILYFVWQKNLKFQKQTLEILFENVVGIRLKLTAELSRAER